MLKLTVYTTRPNHTNPLQWATGAILEGIIGGKPYVKSWNGNGGANHSVNDAKQMADDNDAGLCVNYAQHYDR